METFDIFSLFPFDYPEPLTRPTWTPATIPTTTWTKPDC